MNIVNFTPFAAFTGGAIIGLAVVLFFIGNGRLAGVSGIASNFLTSKIKRIDNLLFLTGLIVGPIIFSIFICRTCRCTICFFIYYENRTI